MCCWCRPALGCLAVSILSLLARACCNADVGLDGSLETETSIQSPFFTVINHDIRFSPRVEAAGPPTRRPHVGPSAAFPRRPAWALRRVLLCSTAAIAVVAAAFLVLRCAWALGVGRRSEGGGRSLAGVGGGDNLGACGGAFGRENPSNVSRGGSSATGASLQQWALKLLDKFNDITKIWVEAIAPLNAGDRLNMTLYFEILIFMELGALSGLVEGPLWVKKRKVTKEAMHTIRLVLSRTPWTRKMSGRRCSMRRLLDGLSAIKNHETAEGAITPAQREEKLMELLHLQHVVTDMLFALVKDVASAGAPLTGKRLAYIVGVRKRQTFGDELLSKSLVECQNTMKHYRIVKEERVEGMKQKVHLMSLEMKLEELRTVFPDAEAALAAQIESRDVVLTEELTSLEGFGSSELVSTCIYHTRLGSDHGDQMSGTQSSPSLPQKASTSLLGPATAPATLIPPTLFDPSAVSSGPPPSLGGTLPPVSFVDQPAAYPPSGPPESLLVPPLPSLPGFSSEFLPASQLLPGLSSGTSLFGLQATDVSLLPLELPVTPSGIPPPVESEPLPSQALTPPGAGTAGAAPLLHKPLTSNASFVPQKPSKAPGAHRKKGPKFEGFAEGMPPPASPPAESASAQENQHEVYEPPESTN